MLQDIKQSSVPAREKRTSAVLGKLGSLETRLALTTAEKHAAQSVRYRVFCEEMSAKVDPDGGTGKRERDSHDSLCDHLLVIDSLASQNEGIIGTQRFLVSKPPAVKSSFYSQQEFDVNNLILRHPDKTFMELGRSCILPEYRGKRTMELMWQGTWAYALQNRVDVMLGCASIPALDFGSIREELGFLARHSALDTDWSVSPTGETSVELSNFQDDMDDERQALRKLPPLVKGYLRLGAMFSTHAVQDQEFGTVDVLVILPVERINRKYVKYYGEDASKHRG